MKKVVLTFSLLLTMLAVHAFCGFYVAKAGAEIFNNTSQVIFVRDGSKSVITMSNDFSGDVEDFAMVVPVPEILERSQIRVADASLFTKLDAYSGPRLVEYYDENPCMPRVYKSETLQKRNRVLESNDISPAAEEYDKELGVTVEATYAVGSYDILILSAKESDGLEKWLTLNGYKIPAKASRVLQPYIKSNMKFFVVKVNIEAFNLEGYSQLKPLQIEFESDRFMLPIRLGMANSKGEQDMIVCALTKTGRVECANYRTLEVPSNREVPTFVKEKFVQFYPDVFEKSHQVAGKNTVFVEYAWNVSPNWNGVKCDPCVGAPPIFSDLSNAGVWWVNSGQASPVFFTRLHVRYSEDLFPEDLAFLITPNTTNFQGRYIIRNPANGDLSCDEGEKYLNALMDRRKRELSELNSLTNWNTAKYTKYVENGSGWIDEKKGEIVPGFVVQPKSKPPYGLILIGLIILGFLSINFILDHRKMKKQTMH